jgi:hypothetical protein
MDYTDFFEMTDEIFWPPLYMHVQLCSLKCCTATLGLCQGDLQLQARTTFPGRPFHDLRCS